MCTHSHVNVQTCCCLWCQRADMQACQLPAGQGMAMACQALDIPGNVMPFHDCVMAVIPVKGELCIVRLIMSLLRSVNFLNSDGQVPPELCQINAVS